MRRWAFNLVAAVSLLLCAATGVFWVRSYGVDDSFWLDSSAQTFFIETGGGQFRFEHTRRIDGSVFFPRFDHRTNKAHGPVEEGMRMPGSRQHFRK